MAALSHGCKPRIALLVVLRTSRCHTHEMGKFHGVADRVQSPNHVMQQVEKTWNNKSTTERKRTNNASCNTKKHAEMVIYFYPRASSENQGQSVGSGERARRKFSSTGERALGYRLSPNYFQNFKQMPAPDWAQKMLCIIVPNWRTVSPAFFS